MMQIVFDTRYSTTIKILILATSESILVVGNMWLNCFDIGKKENESLRTLNRQ
jgi:hypothetical protein